MRLWSNINKCMVDTCGVFPDGRVVCITDEGRWVQLPTWDLSRKPCNPDMSITVGHIVDNPTFPFDGDVEITETDGDGTVHTLYDDKSKDFWGREIPPEILCRKITYMVVNGEVGRLRIEVG